MAEQSADSTAFDTTATPAEQSSFNGLVAGPLVKEAVAIEEYVVGTGSLDIGNGALNISAQDAPGQWYSAMSAEIDNMQTVELEVARNIVARAQVLQRGAEQSALFTGILTAAILLLVMIATFAVARSLVLPLRRLRAGALDIATVQLPERVQQLAEAEDPATSLEVAPIDVLSTDEIGQVARAFDQVHSEAVRLAGNEAMLRSSFNAMFVNLSRRSQALIERLARTIDSLEQNEQDPDRLSYLFVMDHLVTRMRRNSENLLLLAGHDSARRWSEPVSLADVIRAATSEIEQYARVALSVQPGIWISGQAVSDIVRLLAEIIENATTFSPNDTQVRVSASGLTSGVTLIEVSDSGLGLSEDRLTEINSRLTNPPVIDVSVSRHMGLFAVARLAERHGVRVQIRAGSPQGLTALVWLPDSLTERETGTHGGRSQPRAAQADFPARRTAGRHSMAVRSASDDRSADDRPDAVAASTPMAASAPETVQAAALAASEWFRSPRGGEVAGLPVRVPQANLIPGSAGRGRQADIGVASRPADDHEAQTPAASRPQRSPETARRRLSGFQHGTRRAEGQTPHTAKEADR